ncbi:MAG: iron ABC transporter permease [Planctomycetota bacterium]
MTGLTEPRRPIRALALSTVALLLTACGLAISVGAESIDLARIFDVLLSGPAGDTDSTVEHTIVWRIRLPRIALMAVVGAALAPAGAAYQGLFRNPLADPYVVGVASGAGLGAVIVLTVGGVGEGLGTFAVPIGAFFGGLTAVFIALGVSRLGRSSHSSTLLLSGIVVGSFANSVMTLWMLRSPDGPRRALLWLFGGYAGGGWTSVAVATPYVVVGLIGLLLSARSLNALQLSDEEAIGLGVRVKRARLGILASATLMTGAAVAFGGVLGFVGLIVPHALRLLGGPDYRRLIPLSAIAGAGFLVLCDLVARTLFAPEEFPVGVLTALTGAPFFLFVLIRQRRAMY